MREARAGRRKSVLLVDQGEDWARKYGPMLAARGYALVVAPDHETAVRMVAEQRFDAVVSDVGMPNGARSALAAIHRRRSDMPLVLLSSELGFASARAALECGAFRYMLEPVSGDDLLRVLKDAVREDERHPSD